MKCFLVCNGTLKEELITDFIMTTDKKKVRVEFHALTCTSCNNTFVKKEDKDKLEMIKKGQLETAIKL